MNRISDEYLTIIILPDNDRRRNAGGQDLEAVVWGGPRNVHRCGLLWHKFSDGFGRENESRHVGRMLLDCKTFHCCLITKY